MFCTPFSSQEDEETFEFINTVWESVLELCNFTKLQEFADVSKRYNWSFREELQIRWEVCYFLDCLNELMDLLEVPVTSRSFRQTYDRNYRRQFPNDNERFFNEDILDAGILNTSQVIVNGNAYEISEINNRSFDAGFQLTRHFIDLCKAFADFEECWRTIFKHHCQMST